MEIIHLLERHTTSSGLRVSAIEKKYAVILTTLIIRGFSFPFLNSIK